MEMNMHGKWKIILDNHNRIENFIKMYFIYYRNGEIGEIMKFKMNYIYLSQLVQVCQLFITRSFYLQLFVFVRSRKSQH